MLIAFSTSSLFAQALITDEETPTNIDGSAIFELRSIDGTQGFLPPRVLMIRNNGNPKPASDQFTTTPADGLIIYNPGGGTDAVDKGLWYYDGGLQKWVIYSNQGSIFANSVNNYAEFYEHSDSPTGTPYTLTAGTPSIWNSGEYDLDVMGGYFQPSCASGESGCSSLTVTSGGIYQVTMTGVFYRISNLTLEVALYVNGASTDKIYGMAKLASNGDARGIGASGMVHLNANDVIDVRFISDASGSVGLVNFNLTLYKVGEDQ